MRIAKHAALFVLAATLIVGCGDHVGQAAGAGATASPIPWTSAKPSFPPYVRPTAAPVPTDVARCDPHALRIDPGDYQGAMGSLYGVVFLDNISSVSCLVEGPFTARFITRSGRIALTTNVTPLPAAQSAPLTPGWAIAGRVQIQWSALWCHVDDPIVAFELTYEGVAFRASERPFSGGNACDVLGANGASATVWPFGPRPTAPPPPVPSVIVPTIEAPARVVAGQTLTYTVSLRNTSNADVRLEPCPNYIEWLGGRLVGAGTPPPGFPSSKPWIGDKTYIGAAKEGYALNCSGVTIAAGRATTFEMRLQVPIDALGHDTLRWMLAGPAENQASFPLEIEAQASAPIEIGAGR